MLSVTLAVSRVDVNLSFLESGTHGCEAGSLRMKTGTLRRKMGILMYLRVTLAF